MQVGAVAELRVPCGSIIGVSGHLRVVGIYAGWVRALTCNIEHATFACHLILLRILQSSLACAVVLDSPLSVTELSLMLYHRETPILIPWTTTSSFTTPTAGCPADAPCSVSLSHLVDFHLRPALEHLCRPPHTHPLTATLSQQLGARTPAYRAPGGALHDDGQEGVVAIHACAFVSVTPL